jgi:hypothetical protein
MAFHPSAAFNKQLSDEDGSSLSLRDTVGYIEISPGDGDILSAHVVPPVVLGGQSPVDLPTELHALFLGTKGGRVSAKAGHKAISWLVGANQSRAPSALSGETPPDETPKLDVVVGMDTETGKKGGAGLIQVSSRGEDEFKRPQGKERWRGGGGAEVSECS